MHYAWCPVVVRQLVQECVNLPFSLSLGQAPAPDLKFYSFKYRGHKYYCGSFWSGTHYFVLGLKETLKN